MLYAMLNVFIDLVREDELSIDEVPAEFKDNVIEELGLDEND